MTVQPPTFFRTQGFVGHPSAYLLARLVALLALISTALLVAGCGSEEQSEKTAQRPQSDADVAEGAAAAAEDDVARLRQVAKELKAEGVRNATARRAAETLPTRSASDGQQASTTSAGNSATRASSAGLLSASDRRSFQALASELPGQEGIAISPLGFEQPVEALGGLQTGAAWSTSKVPVAMAAINAGAGASEDLLQAITASDNAAAERLWDALGGGSQAATAATEQLRLAGDTHTQIQANRLRSGLTPFGQTAWALPDQVRFMAGMFCTTTGMQVLELMKQVIPAHRWGLGAAAPNAGIKGGWGPGITPGAADGWLDRQMGVITINGRAIAIVIATTASDHATGTRNLTALARWAKSHVKARDTVASC